MLIIHINIYIYIFLKRAVAAPRRRESQNDIILDLVVAKQKTYSIEVGYAASRAMQICMSVRLRATACISNIQ